MRGAKEEVVAAVWRKTEITVTGREAHLLLFFPSGRGGGGCGSGGEMKIEIREACIKDRTKTEGGGRMAKESSKKEWMVMVMAMEWWRVVSGEW